MSTLVVVGAQWGDEGKGKVVDVLAERADVVVRYSGGNNAGHTLVVAGEAIVTHLVPSGCLYAGTQCVLGAGMVIDPDVFREEIDALQGRGLLAHDELRVSLDAHLILAVHRDIDGLREDRAVGADRIGTTRRGVGPAYEAKAARRGIRVRDLFSASRLRARLEHIASELDPELARLGADATIDVAALEQRATTWARWLEPMACDAGRLVHDAIRSGRHVLFEGAQGAMLDLDHGTYPYVTSSTTTAGGACTGVGIGPTAIDDVWGITKAYTTRVGAGPFPTRLDGEAGDRLRVEGNEYGATTGRPRDCGWLDLPALRYAARINGLTGLCLTKLDVLARLPHAMVCDAYEDGREPGRDALDGVVPHYRALEGWGDPAIADGLARARTRRDLPAPVQTYLELIEDAVGVAIVLVSVGAGRDQTLLGAQPFERDA